MKGILIICNLDTRGKEIAFVKDIIERRGHSAILLDFSMEVRPPISGDITCEEVAERGGMMIDDVRKYYQTNREIATENQIKGTTEIVRELIEKNMIHGVIGIGGATATLVSTSVMRKLPFGFPKLMATPMAAHSAYIEKYIGTCDITMHHTVLDIVQMNPLLETQIINAVGAICGMIEVDRRDKTVTDNPIVAVSSFGFGELTVQASLDLLKKGGFIPVVFHAQGKGDMAMEEMIRHGSISGVVDLCIGGVIEHLFGGNRDPGPGRLMAAVRRGIPMVLAPCGLDILSYGGRPDKIAATEGRKRYIQDSLRIQVRTDATELREVADVIAERLNQAIGPFTFLLPTRGWSSLDRRGEPMHDPIANAAFVERLKEKVVNKTAIKEFDVHFYTTEFANIAVSEFVNLYKGVKM